MILRDELNSSQPKITVGLPVYNGEEFIRRRLDSILSQTLTDFELVISDNASDDATAVICEEYAKKDSRIRYVRQKTNIGFINNFNFLISEAKGKYFVGAAVDDLWEPTFLEENTNVLDSCENVVGSIGNVVFFGYKEQPKLNRRVSRLKKIIRKQNTEPLYNHVVSVSGDYEKKANRYLRFNQGSFVYGLFRTEKLRKRLIIGPISAWDLVVILNILKEGDLHVIDKVLVKKYALGLSSKGWFNSYKRKEINFLDLILPFSSLWMWCIRNIGMRFFLKNIDWFTLLTVYGWRSVLIELSQKDK